MFKVSANKLIVDLEGMKEAKRAEEEAVAATKMAEELAAKKAAEAAAEELAAKQAAEAAAEAAAEELAAKQAAEAEAAELAAKQAAESAAAELAAKQAAEAAAAAAKKAAEEAANKVVEQPITNDDVIIGEKEKTEEEDFEYLLSQYKTAPKLKKLQAMMKMVMQ